MAVSFLCSVAAGNAKEGESGALTRQGRKEGEGATFPSSSFYAEYAVWKSLSFIILHSTILARLFQAPI